MEEQEFLKDTEQLNIDKQKHVNIFFLYYIRKHFVFLQWDEHYRKMALKQRRGSIAYRFSFKAQPTDNQNELITSNFHLSSAVVNETNRIHDDNVPEASHFDLNLPPTQKRSSHDEQINDNHFPMTNSRTLLKSNRTNGETKNDSLANVKNSKTCTIQ